MKRLLIVLFAALMTGLFLFCVLCPLETKKDETDEATLRLEVRNETEKMPA